MNRQPPAASRQPNRPGWTLIELLVVIAIIALLIAYLTPILVGHVLTRARIVATQQQLDELKKALVGDPSLGMIGDDFVAPGYHGDVGTWPPPAPSDTTGLTWLWKPPPGVPAWNPYTHHGWNGPYIRSDSSLSFLDDPWGNPIRYIRDSTGNPVGLESLGPDGVLGAPVSGSQDDDIKVYF